MQIVYLVYLVAGHKEAIPIVSLVMIGAIYGLQALVFILRRKWDMASHGVLHVLSWENLGRRLLFT
jgi:chitin synthase